jgi:leader peptidase (prepilin peptidase)/N-methyltransferase
VKTAAFVVAAAFAAVMLAIAVSDWRTYRVPNRLTAAALALRVVDLVVAPPAPLGDAFLQATIRAIVMTALFYLFRWAYGRLRGREGLGLGDVKLAGVAGAWVDWRFLPTVVEFAALFGLALALYRAARSGAGLRAATKLPFAVGFAPAIFMGWQMQRLGF